MNLYQLKNQKQQNDILNRITLHKQRPELDNDYNQALLKLLLREVIFELQYRVEKEKKWWRFWETGTEKALSQCIQTIRNPASENRHFLTEINSKKALLDDLSKYHLQQILGDAGFDTRFDECIVTQQNHKTTISRIAEALKEKAACRDELLLLMDDEQQAIDRFINEFGFARNIPKYHDLSTTDKRNWEKLALLAISPAIGRPSEFISSLNEPRHCVDILSKDVAGLIGGVYGIVLQQTDHESFDMGFFLNQIAAKCSFLGTWSSPYKIIKKIMALTQESAPLSDAKIARVLKYIDELPACFQHNCKNSLRTIFLDVHQERGIKIIEKSLGQNLQEKEKQDDSMATLKVFSAYQQELLNSPLNHKNDNDARIHISSVPKNAKDIEKLVYLIIHQNLPGFLAEYEDSAPLVINQYQLTPNYLLLSVFNPDTKNFLLLKKSPELYYLFLLFFVLLHYSVPFSPGRQELVKNMLRLLNGECPVAMTDSFSWLNRYIPNPFPSLIAHPGTYSALKQSIQNLFPTTPCLGNDDESMSDLYSSSRRSSSFFHHLTPSIARPSVQFNDVSDLLPECIAIHDDLPAEQKEFKQHVQAIRQRIINIGTASEKGSIEVSLNELLNTSEILDRRVIILKVLLEWYIAFRGTQDYVNRTGQSALIQQCRLVATQLSKSANEMMELNELYQSEKNLPPDSSGAKLLRAIKKLFPSGQVNNPYTLYAAKMFGYAKAIDNRSDKHHQILLHLSRNINLYPQKNYWSIAILTLHQWLHDQEYTIEEDKIDKEVAEILMNNTEDNDLFAVQLQLIIKDSEFFDKISEACIPKTINFSSSQPILEEVSVEEIPEIDPTAQECLDRYLIRALDKAKKITPTNNAILLNNFVSEETKAFFRPFTREHLVQLPNSVELYYLLSWYGAQHSDERLPELVKNLKAVIANPDEIELVTLKVALVAFVEKLKEGPLFDLLCPKSTFSFSQSSWLEKIEDEVEKLSNEKNCVKTEQNYNFVL